MVIEDEDNDNLDQVLIVPTNLSGVGRGSVGMDHPSGIDSYNVSDGDGRPAVKDLLLIGVNWGNMTVERMDELVSRYGVAPGYICKVPLNQ